jgi:hypothetical protein
MNTCYVVRSSRPEGLFSFGLLNGLTVRLRRPYLREAPAGFGLERLATAFMNNPGFRFLREMCIGSPLPVGEPTSFQQGGTKMLPTTNPRIRCDAVTSKPRSGRMSARRVHSSQRPSLAHLRISPACAEPLHWEAFGLPGASFF